MTYGLKWNCSTHKENFTFFCICIKKIKMHCIGSWLQMIPAQKFWKYSCQDSCNNLKECSRVWHHTALDRICIRFLKYLARFMQDFLQEISKKNLARILTRNLQKSWQESCRNLDKNFDKNFTRFATRSCRILQIVRNLTRLCNSCKIFARILARFLSRVYQRCIHFFSLDNWEYSRVIY
jgi:hypothetical protein